MGRSLLDSIPEPALLGCCCSTAEAVPAMAMIEALVDCCSVAVSVPATAVPATAVPATAVPQPADQAAVPVTQVCKPWPSRQLPEDL